MTVGEFVAFIIGWNMILEYIIGTASCACALSGWYKNDLKAFLFSWNWFLTVAVSEIWDILEMGKKNARTFLKF